MRPPVKKALVRVVLFVVFGCLGGPLFWAIEHRGDQRAMKAALLQSLNASMSAKYNMTAQDFENFTRISFEALRPSTASWTLEEAVEFSFQTITTIGYGNITPVTPLGQAACIFFSLIGIPVTLLALKSVGELIKEGLMKLVREFETRLLRRRQVQHCAAKCALLCFFLTVAMLCLGALLSMMTSHWTFLEGIYFWYISFTTVGFGDYVPPTVHGITKEPHSSEATHLLTEIALQAFYSLWFVPGLCMVASVISSIQDALEKSPYQGACFGCLATNSYGVGEALRRDVGPTGSFSFTEQQVNGAFELVDLSKLEDGFNTKM